MDAIKEAFNKIKEEITFLKEEIQLLQEQINFLNMNQSNDKKFSTEVNIPTNNPTQTPTVPVEMKGLKTPEKEVSIRNEGVPTVKPTDRQSNQQTDIYPYFNQKNTPASSIISQDALQETLFTLDAIKKEIRIKFKRLTSQEMLVFSTLYNLESQGIEEITYKSIAQTINLTESSIRDYIHKILSKGIPIIKQRLNNKKIILIISPELKKIASLQTINKLREI